MNTLLTLKTPCRQHVKRYLSLDVFRGLTVVLMILVNSPGTPTTYTWLRHADWDGCTFADLVFPFFLFIMGLSLSLLSRSSQRPILVIKMAKRSLFLFIVGLLLNAFPHVFDIATLRVYGVLQRIALCYFFSALLILNTTLRTQWGLFFGLTIGYWLLMTQFFPGYTQYTLTPEANLAAFIDQHVFSSSHLYGHTFDPEGILSTLPAIATTLLGYLTARSFSLFTNAHRIPPALYILSIGFLSIGWLWGYAFPINKTLWSSSYVYWTGGISMLCFALCYWLFDIKQPHWQARWLQSVGRHALLLYVLHILFLKIQALIFITQENGLTLNLRRYITEQWFYRFSSEQRSLLYALSYTLLWIMIANIYAYIKKIPTKITWHSELPSL